MSRRRLAQFDRFRSHGARTVFVARSITGQRAGCAVLAGSSGLPRPKFIRQRDRRDRLVDGRGIAGYSSPIAGTRWSAGSDARLIGLAAVIAAGIIALVRARRNPQP
jgi:hypothetical protein